MLFFIHACHHQNGHFLVWRLFISFLSPSAVAQSAPFKNRAFVDCVSVVSQICMSVEQKASVPSVNTHAASACSGHLLPRKFSLSLSVDPLLCVELSPQALIEVERMFITSSFSTIFKKYPILPRSHGWYKHPGFVIQPFSVSALLSFCFYIWVYLLPWVGNFAC